MISPRRALLALLVLPSLSQAAALDYTARGSYVWTENVGRALAQADSHDASRYEAAFSTGLSRQLASGLLGRAQLELAGATTPEYRKLDEATFGPRLTLTRKFGLGPNAPTLAAEVSTLGRLARINENEGVTLQGALTLSKRFGPIVALSLKGEWQEHVAQHNTFDVHHYSGSAMLTVDPTDRLRLTTGVGRLSGNFTVGASAARFAGALGGALGPEVATYFADRPRTVTNSLETGWTTYRVEGDIDFWWFEVSPALTDQLTLSARYERTHATNIVDVEYRQDIFTLSVIYVF